MLQKMFGTYTVQHLSALLLITAAILLAFEIIDACIKFCDFCNLKQVMVIQCFDIEESQLQTILYECFKYFVRAYVSRTIINITLTVGMKQDHLIFMFSQDLIPEQPLIVDLCVR